MAMARRDKCFTGAEAEIVLAATRRVATGAELCLWYGYSHEEGPPACHACEDGAWIYASRGEWVWWRLRGAAAAERAEAMAAAAGAC